MKPYHTYTGVAVASCLLKQAQAQGKGLTNLQLQKLTYICHGLSLAHFQRPLIIDDVFAWQYGPVVPAVYFRFQAYGAQVIDLSSALLEDEQFDAESEAIIRGVVKQFGDLTGPQLVNLTHREGSPWQQVWDGEYYQVIPDPLIQSHYTQIKQLGRTTSL